VPAALLQYIRGAAREAAGSVAVRGGTTWRGADGRHGADDTPPVVVRAAHGALCHLHAAPHHAILHVPKASGVHVREDERKKARMKVMATHRVARAVAIVVCMCLCDW
jgi:hypothetical protein